MKQSPSRRIIAFLIALPLAAEATTFIDGDTPPARMAAHQAYCATMSLSNNEARAVMIPVAARILAGRENEAALAKWTDVAASVYRKSKERLDKRASDNNARNPFEKHALIHAYLICRDKQAIPAAAIADMKRYVELYKHKKWFGYGALNYRLMNDGAGFIAAEIWPDLRDSDGLDSAGIREATGKRLFGYFDEIVRRNTEEYAAPTYLGVDLSVMKMLADFARDPEMRNRAAITLDSMLLQVACAWNKGYCVTPASRAKYYGSTVTGPHAPDTTAAIGWMLFGGTQPINVAASNPAGSFWFTVPRGYHPPAVMTNVATDRSKPFTHRGGFGDKVRFTIHHEPGYSVASQVEFATNPNDGIYKETRRTMFKWVSNHPRSTFCPLQDNPQRPYRLADGRRNAFGYGENPFTQVLQHQRTLVGISKVPADYPHWQMYAPFPASGAIIRRIERDGWIFCHGGSVLFSFRYLQPARWEKRREKENCDVLRSEARTNGWVLETAPLADFAGGGVDQELERFAGHFLTKSRLLANSLGESTPRLSYQALDGTRLDIDWRAHNQRYTDQHRINGKPVEYMKFPMFGNPWVNQDFGASTLTIRHGNQQVVYDFESWKRTIR